MRSALDARLTRSRRMVLAILVAAICASFSPAQQPSAQTVPHVVSFSGTVLDSGGHPRSGITGVTFALYKEQEGGAPLWLETQSVQLDAKGHYSVQLGTTKTDGLPLDLFVSGEARWLGVRPEGQPEQTRALLVSVPYALKAADADTIGGRPVSAFVLAPVSDGSSGDSSTTAPPPAAVTGNGTANFLPLWTSATNLGNSVLFQSGTGTSAKLGIGTSTPQVPLDVRGATNIQGLLQLPPTRPATAGAGSPSQPVSLVASAFNSGTSAPVNQTFQWKAEPAANNTASPSGTLNLLYGLGAAAPVETGLKIAKNGQFTFAAGQIFPGAVTTVTAGGDLSGGGSGGSVTLSLNRTSTDTRYAQLAAANTFTQNQTLNGNMLLLRSDSTSLGNRMDINNSSLSGNSFSIYAATAANSVTAAMYADGLGTSPLAVPSGYFGTYSAHPTAIYTANRPRIYIAADGAVGIPTSAPQALLNLNQGFSSNTLLLGNSTKGLMLRDTGAALDIESIGYPLYLNNTTAEPTLINARGGQLLVGTDVNDFEYDLQVGGPAHLESVLLVDADTFLQQDLRVQGTKNFHIDHPVDPEHKYLNHAAIESSEVLNMYTGNVRLDDKGEGTVTLPGWFGALNTDYRYQLTAVGAPGPNLYVAQEIEDGTFRIAGGAAGMKVSWQVSCLRNDAYMQAHPFVVEEDKPAADIGFYAAPALYGQPADRGVFSTQHLAAVAKSKKGGPTP